MFLLSSLVFGLCSGIRVGSINVNLDNLEIFPNPGNAHLLLSGYDESGQHVLLSGNILSVPGGLDDKNLPKDAGSYRIGSAFSSPLCFRCLVAVLQSYSDLVDWSAFLDEIPSGHEDLFLPKPFWVGLTLDQAQRLVLRLYDNAAVFRPVLNLVEQHSHLDILGQAILYAPINGRVEMVARVGSIVDKDDTVAVVVTQGAVFRIAAERPLMIIKNYIHLGQTVKQGDVLSITCSI